MVNWLLIGIVILLIVIVFIKFEHHTKRIKFIVLILFVAFLYFSVSSVVNRNEIKLNSADGWIKTGSLYFAWLGDLGSGIWHAGGEAKGIIGNTIKSNSTKASNSDDWKVNIRK